MPTDLTSARQLGQRWLNAGGGWAVGMRVLAEPDDEPLPDDTGPPINTVVAVESELVTVAWSTWAGSAEGGTLLRDDVPDVTDAATLGAMLGIVRGLWGPAAQVSPWTGLAAMAVSGWRFCANDANDWTSPSVASEAEALVCAAESWARGRVASTPTPEKP